MRPLLSAAARIARRLGQLTLDKAAEQVEQPVAIGLRQQCPACQRERSHVRGRGGPLAPLSDGASGTLVGMKDERAALAAVTTDMAHHLPGSPGPELLAVSFRHGGGYAARRAQ